MIKFRLSHCRYLYVKCIVRAMLMSGLLVTVPAKALGPVDGEVGVFTWVVDDYQDTSVNSPLTGGYGELWLGERWGFRTALYRISEDSVSMAPDEQTLVDFKYRLVNATDNTFLAVGLGWEQNRFGAEGDASGARIMAEGRVGVLGFLRFYAEAGWAPSLGDLGSRRDLSSISVETGLVLDPFPFVDLRLGWRYQITDYTGAITGSAASEGSYGVLVGGGIHW